MWARGPLIARRRASADEQLVARLRAGDDAAFTEIHDRYRRPLLAYARRFLVGGLRDDAEDVVQDVLTAAHRALRTDEREIVLRPWLYRLTRNRSIDAVRRVHHGDVELTENDDHDAHSDPFAVVTRRETLHTLVVDIAGLPERQRTALLARELEGASYHTIASQLGITAVAARVLAMRARDNLVKADQARTASCTDVRAVLAAAHDRGARPSEHARRHVQHCNACREYRRELKRVRVAVRALAPPIGLAPLVVLGNVLGSGGAKTAALAVLVVGVAASGGVTVLATGTHDAGDPAPFSLHFRRPDNERLRQGDAIPRDTAIVTAQVTLSTDRPRGERRTVTLQCPPGMRLAGFESPEQKDVPARMSYGLDKNAILGHSTRGRIHFSSRPLARAHDDGRNPVPPPGTSRLDRSQPTTGPPRRTTGPRVRPLGLPDGPSRQAVHRHGVPQPARRRDKDPPLGSLGARHRRQPNQGLARDHRPLPAVPRPTLRQTLTEHRVPC